MGVNRAIAQAKGDAHPNAEVVVWYASGAVVRPGSVFSGNVAACCDLAGAPAR